MTDRFHTPIVVTVTAMLFLAAVGCSSSGRRPASSATDSLSSFQREIQKNKEQITATLASLDKVTSAATSNREREFKKFVKSVSKIESREKAMNRRAQQMQSKGDRFFDAWQEEFRAIENAELRKRSAERRQEAVQRQREITEETRVAAAAFGPLMGDLNDISSALRYDLTAAGIESVGDLMQRARTNAAELQGHLDAVAALLQREQQAMSSR